MPFGGGEIGVAAADDVADDDETEAADSKLIEVAARARARTTIARSLARSLSRCRHYMTTLVNANKLRFELDRRRLRVV